MSYCLNPDCPQPQNPNHAEICLACGSKLLVRDRYRITKALGQGGFGATFLIVDQALPGEPISVLKQLKPASTDPQVLEMARDLFEREARTLGKVGNHPQVPRLLDYFEERKQFFLVQEYVSGWTLQQEVKRGGPFSEAGVKQFLSEMLPVLQYIHSQQVIHRDLKPANMIRREEDRKLVLIDFGAVKNQVSQTAILNSSEHSALTSYAIGTPGYAPPEQMAMRPVYASDIYALGVTCVYLLTGKSPKDLDYDPSTGEMLWFKGLQLSDHFTEVLRKMMEVSVRHRYQSAEEALRALDIAPYMDGLAQGLTTQPYQSMSQTGSSTDLSGFQSPATSASSQMGMAIRARRDRMAQSNSPPSSQLASPNTRDRYTPQTPAPKSQAATPKSANPKYGTVGVPKTPGKPVKLDAPTVIASYGKGRRDFAEEDLSRLILVKANLTSANFHQAKLLQTNLQGANLSNADFGRASLNRANLRDANLTRGYFSYADLEEADLRGADLSAAYLNYANLRGANLCGANLTGAKISEDQLAQAKTNWATTLPSGKRGFW